MRAQSRAAPALQCLGCDADFARELFGSARATRAIVGLQRESLREIEDERHEIGAQFTSTNEFALRGLKLRSDDASQFIGERVPLRRIDRRDDRFRSQHLSLGCLGRRVHRLRRKRTHS